MLNITNIISLPVINLYEVKIEGYIEKIYINSKKLIDSLLIYDEQNDCYKVVKYSNIYKITDNAIFITNSSKITLYENLQLSLESLAYPVNAQCYSLSGNFLGTLQDISLEANKVIGVVINNKFYKANNISGFSNSLILISEDKKINTNKFRPAKRNFSQLLPRSNEPVVAILNTPPSVNTKTTNFLINRQATKDIMSPNGEILIKKNTAVTQSHITKLTYYGKLKELTLNSK